MVYTTPLYMQGLSENLILYSCHLYWVTVVKIVAPIYTCLILEGLGKRYGLLSNILYFSPHKTQGADVLLNDREL